MQGSNLPPKAFVPIFDIAVLCNIFSTHKDETTCFQCLHTLRLRHKNLVQAEANFWICISSSLEVDVVAVISTTICLQVKWFLIMYGVFAAWGHTI